MSRPSRSSGLGSTCSSDWISGLAKKPWVSKWTQRACGQRAQHRTVVVALSPWSSTTRLGLARLITVSSSWTDPRPSLGMAPTASSVPWSTAGGRVRSSDRGQTGHAEPQPGRTVPAGMSLAVAPGSAAQGTAVSSPSGTMITVFVSAGKRRAIGSQTRRRSVSAAGLRAPLDNRRAPLL